MFGDGSVIASETQTMPIEVKMPRLSDTMEVGTVVKWNVKEGQKVKSGDVIADIETDKATMELQSFDDGTVASIPVKEGESVKVGTVIMMLAGQGEDVNAAKSAKPAEAAATKSQQAGAAGEPAGPRATGTATAARTESEPAAHGANGQHTGERVFASPLAKKIAAEAGVDLKGLGGSGPSGRIIRKDVEAAIAGGGVARLSEPGVPPSARPMPAPMPAPGAALKSRSVPLSNMRRTIAKRLIESKTTIPHYQVTVNARMDALMTLRAQLNEQLASQGVKLSVNDFLVRACALAMHQHPYVNSRWGADGASVEFVGDVNVGVAIALPVAEDGSGGGLVVATLRHADQMGLRQISSLTKALSDKARAKGLTLEEMSDSTFTISNLGMFGVEHFTAIINPPNTAILAVGAAVEKAVVVTGADGKKTIGVGHEMSMTMSSDHRVIDGAMAARYLATVRDLLEKPATLLV
jgi:pyruvate dehydrogenase E2 component (dihydrolipoamide acetyltransferase)